MLARQGTRGMAHTASTSRLWGGDGKHFCDVQLQLCTFPHHHSCDEPEEGVTQRFAASVAGRGSEEISGDGVAAADNTSLEPAVSQAAASDSRRCLAAPLSQRTCMRSFFLHGAILAIASPYFMKRMTGWAGSCGNGDGGSGGNGDSDDSCSGDGGKNSCSICSDSTCGGSGGVVGGGGGGGDGTSVRSHGTVLRYADSVSAVAGADAPAGVRWLLVEHVEDAEVDVVEAVLRHCYTGSLCEEGCSTEQLSTATLLNLAILADRFDVPLCLAHCCEELAGRASDQYDLPTINLVFGGVPPGLHTAEFHSDLVSFTTARLLHLLGDAEAVCGARYSPNSDLDAQLLQLSLPSLLVLLSSDSLTARSENSVLMMADAWVAGPAGVACSAVQLRQVAAVLRLGKLTQTFTFDVLKQLPWLQLSDEEHGSLLHFCAAGLAGGAQRQAGLVQSSRTCGPATWYDNRKRIPWPGAAGLTVIWKLSWSELAAHLESGRGRGAVVLCGPRSFFNGFYSEIRFLIKEVPEPKAGLAIAVGVERNAMEKPGVALRDYVLKATLSLTEVEGGGSIQVWDGPTVHNVTCVLQPSRVSGPQLLDVAGWAPYMQQGGVMPVRCTVSSCT